MLVPFSNISSVEGKIAALNKRCVKLGIEEITYTISEPMFNSYTLTDGKKYTFKVVEVLVDKPSVCLDGWNILAMIDNSEAATLVHGRNVDESYYEVSDRRCDHCNTSHKRKFQWVISDGSNELVVGKACLKDYVGHDTLKSVDSLWNLIWDLEHLEESYGEEEYFNTTNREVSSTVLEVMKSIVYSYRLNKGWIKDDQFNYTVGCAKEALKKDEDLSEFGDEAATIIEWASNKTPDSTDNYWNNILQLIKIDDVPNKYVALVGSMICGYKYMIRTLEREAISDSSLYVGELDKRMRFDDYEVTRIHSYESMYGTQYFVNFKDADNHILVWKTASGYNYDEGEKYSFDAKVVKHEEYNGLKQTYINRPTKWEEINQ